MPKSKLGSHRTRITAKRNLSGRTARERLSEKVKSVSRDKGRLAATVAPAKAVTPEDVKLQRRWFSDPRRLDFEGIDTPTGQRLEDIIARRISTVTTTRPSREVKPATLLPAPEVLEVTTRVPEPEPEVVSTDALQEGVEVLNQRVEAPEEKPRRTPIVIPQIPPLAGMTPLGIKQPMEPAQPLPPEVVDLEPGFQWDSPSGKKGILQIRGDKALVSRHGEQRSRISSLEDIRAEIGMDRQSLAGFKPGDFLTPEIAAQPVIPIIPEMQVGFEWQSINGPKRVVRVREDGKVEVEVPGQRFHSVFDSDSIQKEIAFDRRSVDRAAEREAAAPQLLAEKLEREQREAERAEATKKEFKDLDEFVASNRPGKRDGVEVSLKAARMVQGRVEPLHKLIERLVKEEGRVIEMTTGGARRLTDPNTGIFMGADALGRTGLAYAEFLVEQQGKPLASAPLVESSDVEPELEEKGEEPETVVFQGETEPSHIRGGEILGGFRSLEPTEPLLVPILAAIPPSALMKADISPTVITAIARELDATGNVRLKNVAVKVVGTFNDKWTTELIDTRSVRHYSPIEYDTLAEAQTGALKDLVTEIGSRTELRVSPSFIEKGDVYISPDFGPLHVFAVDKENGTVNLKSQIGTTTLDADGPPATITRRLRDDQPILSTEGSGVDQAGIGILEGEPAETVQADEDVRGSARNSLDEGGGGQEIGSELYRERRLRGTGLELGDQRSPLETGEGLIEPTPPEVAEAIAEATVELRELDVPEESTKDLASNTLTPPPVPLGLDFVLSEEEIDRIDKSPALRFDANLAAITVLKHLEETNQKATSEQQTILARYSGFGDSAFNNAFNAYAREDIWKERGDKLRQLVTKEEYEAIERSRQNAFYTTPQVIKAMWEGMERLGANNLSRPRVLEPSAGSGRFLGLQPPEMAAKSERVAVELDKTTGALVGQLYQNANTHVIGFEDAPIRNGTIDLAISNVPFGDLRIFDKTYKGRQHLTQRIHNYFFAKTLDKLRPGGVLGFITSHGTLDASGRQSRQIRESLAEVGDLVGAIRLPKGAFPDTEVVTDIIFMRKRLPDEHPGDQSWIDTEPVTFYKQRLDYNGDPAKDFEGRLLPPLEIEKHVNKYFIDHPEMVLGIPSIAGSMRRENEYTVELIEGRDLNADLNAAMASLPEDIITDAPRPSDDELRRQRKPSPRNVRENSYVLDETGKLFTKQGEDLADVNLSPVDTAKVLGMLEVRDAVRAVLQAQINDLGEAEIKAAQADLNRKYDAFVAKHGALNDKANTKLMGNDPDAPLLRAVEFLSAKTKKFEKMDIFTGRVVKGLGQHQATSPLDAMSITLNENGFLDFERMAELIGSNPEAVREQLAKERAIYKDPMGEWEESDKYLSGNVREKLAAAKTAALKDPAFLGNVEVLTGVIPEDLQPSEIYVQLGVPWVPPDDINKFTQELLGIYSSYRQRSPIFSYNETLGEWSQDLPSGKVDANRSRNLTLYGTGRMSGLEIISRLLQGKKVEVNDTIEVDGRPKSVRNEKETVAAQDKANAIQEQFTQWLWSDTDRAERLARYYNDNYNNIVPRQYNGTHQTFPGMALKWADQLHTHQRDAIWRTVEDGTTLLAHEVGFGKTAVMVAAGMELRRLGLARKNVFVVPKATHAQFASQFKDIYPYAKTLFPEKDDFNKANRPEFTSKIATGDWDAVILTNEQFKQLPLSPETQRRFIQEELNDLRAALSETGTKGEEGKAHKAIQKLIQNNETKMLKLNDRIADKADNTLYFEDMGIDQLFVDEADNFKNLSFVTKMGRIKGLPNGQSDRAWDMYQKVRHLQKQGNGRGVVFATGTPVANSVAELWTMMRYLQPGMLEEKKLDKFDAWAKTFGGTTEALEQTAQGTYRLTQRFARFNNIPELSSMWQQAADIRVTSEVPEITKLQPKLINEEGKEARTVVAAPRTDQLARYMDDLAFRAGNLGNVDPTEDNMLKISSDARKASLDMRLVNPQASDNPNSKAAAAVGKITEIYRETTPDKGTQLLFLDLSTPKATKETALEDDLDMTKDIDEETGEERVLLDSVYQDIKRKLISNGIPAAEVQFIHDADTNKKREDLFRKVNSGEVRVVIGSTGKMGVGVNVQERIAALHHLDAPWRPRDIEQREGRAIRQGNRVYGPKMDSDGAVVDPGKGVRIYNYVTEGSFDAYMWQAIEAKAKAIKALLRRKVTLRTIDDADDFVLSASEAKALASGNPDVLKSVQLKNDIRRLQLVKASHIDQQLKIKQSVGNLPLVIAGSEARSRLIEQDKNYADNNPQWVVTIGKESYPEAKKTEANAAMLKVAKDARAGKTLIGKINGFTTQILIGPQGYYLELTGPSGQEYMSGAIPQGDVESGKADILQRALNNIKLLPKRLADTEQEILKHKDDLANYMKQTNAPFERDEQLQRLQAELGEVERRLQNIEKEDINDYLNQNEEEIDRQREEFAMR